MFFRVLIPARYASTRLPGKPLLEIAGKPMLQHVYEAALASGADSVLIATDDMRIVKAANHFGADVCLTSVEHQSGSERLADVVQNQGYADDEIVVNLQGDEPLMPPELLRQVAENLAAQAQAEVATLCTRIKTVDEIFNPHTVKVVMNQAGMALYFSRAPIPWHRDAFAVSTTELPTQTTHYRHLGVYAYRVGYLKRYVTLPASPLEGIESLEQLRVLWHGSGIHVGVAKVEPAAGVDTPDDLARVRRVLAAGSVTVQ